MSKLTAAAVKAWFGRIVLFGDKGFGKTRSDQILESLSKSGDMKQGTYIFPNGDVITGDFVDGKRTGQGKYMFSNGHVYHGNFIDGKRTG